MSGSARADRTTDATGPFQAAAFAMLDTAGVRWAVLRDDPLEVGAADIDLLVHPTDVARLDSVLAPLGYVRLATWRHGEHRFFFAYDEAHGRWVKLDTVSRFEYRTGHHVPIRTAEEVLAARVRVDGAWRVNPSDEFWALTLHCLLDRGFVAPRHLLRLVALGRDDPSGPIREALGSPALAARVVEAARAGNAEALVAMRRAVAAQLRRDSTSARLTRSARGALTPMLKAVLRPGINVVVMGPDGAGKSTLVRSLITSFPLPVRTRYAGLYGERLRAARSTRIPGVALASQLVAAWTAYVGAAVDRRRGRFTIFDRYGYDALLASDRPTTSKRRIRTLLIGHLVPRPDLLLVLDAPAPRLHGRKPEHDLAVVERRRDAYLELADRLAEDVATEIVDTSVDPASVSRRATALIWRAFARRTRPRTGPASRRRYNRAAVRGGKV